MSPRRNWDSPTHLAAGECSLPPGPMGGGAHSPAAKGVGESQFRRLEKKLCTLPTLWDTPCTPTLPPVVERDQWWAKLLRLLTVNLLSYFVKIKY
jgi:hypothetical protein